MGQNADRIKSLYEAFAKGDVATVLRAMDPKIEWNEAEHYSWWPGEAFIGPDAIVQGVFARIPEAFGDTFRIDIQRIVDGGSTVLVQLRYKGTVQSSNTQLDLQAAHVWDVGADGKVTRFQQYVDTYAAAKLLGEPPVTV